MCESPTRSNSLLEDAQELCLQCGTHRPDLVEEQRALVGLLESALPRSDGAGEGATGVTEELRFEERLRNGAAVQGDEAAGASRAVVMDGAGGQFLARTCLSRDQDRARRAGNGLEELEQIRMTRLFPTSPSIR